MFDQLFWRDVLVNLFPDLVVAIIFGVFITLYFQRKQTGQDIQEGRIRILSLLKVELEENIADAKELLAGLEDRAQIGMPGVRYEVWDTFRSSGDLRWLGRDLNLLNKLARGYHSIKALGVYEKHYLDALLHFENSQTRVESMDGVRQHLIQGYKALTAAVEEFLEDPDIKQINTAGFTKVGKRYDGV